MSSDNYPPKTLLEILRDWVEASAGRDRRWQIGQTGTVMRVILWDGENKDDKAWWRTGLSNMSLDSRAMSETRAAFDRLEKIRGEHGATV